MRLQLWQVEVRSGALVDQFLGIMEQIESKVKDGTGCKFSVNSDMCFVQVPSSRSDKQYCCLLTQRIVFPSTGTGVGNTSFHGISQVELAFNQILPGWRCGIFKVGHVNTCSRVESIDYHLSVDRTSDFHSSILNIGWDRGTFPTRVLNGRNVQKLGSVASVKLFGPLLSSAEQVLTTFVEGVAQVANKSKSIGSENFLCRIGRRCVNLKVKGFGLVFHHDDKNMIMIEVQMKP
mmetsp:Transcript_17165/g.41779  ORF Transcript_17165/g.41779 Transcript_17165/m.41779 type:complete len:234 (+) Transcript_17165:3508-4209(+)